MEKGTGRNLQGKNRGSEETLLGERLFHCILILRYLWGTEKYEMAPCSCCKYPAACKIEDGYIWKPAANFSKYFLSTFPVYSLLDTRLCSAPERGPRNWTESRTVWAAGCGCGCVELGEQRRDAIGLYSAVPAAFQTSLWLYSCVWGTALPLSHPKGHQASAEEHSFLLLLLLSRGRVLQFDSFSVQASLFLVQFQASQNLFFSNPSYTFVNVGELAEICYEFSPLFTASEKDIILSRHSLIAIPAIQAIPFPLTRGMFTLAASWGYCFSVLLHQVIFPFSRYMWIKHMLGEVLRSCFVLLSRSTCGSSPFVARPWLPEQLPLAKAGRILEGQWEDCHVRKFREGIWGSGGTILQKEKENKNRRWEGGVLVAWMSTRNYPQNERSLFSYKLLPGSWICVNSVTWDEGRGWEVYCAAFSLVEVGRGSLPPAV